MSWSDATNGPHTFTLGGHHDWRLPNIKELYSLFNARGVFGTTNTDSKPFIDTNQRAWRTALRGEGKRR